VPTARGPLAQRVAARFLQLFFHHFYGDLAWSYDMVAAVVSVGRWRDWINAALPFVHGPRILELAFGTGMLQESLRSRGEAHLVGLDPSRQMVRLTMRRLRRARLSSDGLTRGTAEALPYCSATFSSIVSTFPSEFVFSEETLKEMRRVLMPEGHLVVLPAAWITGGGLLERAAAGLFKITHQAPPDPYEAAARQFSARLEHAGFATRFETVEVRASLVLVLLASIPEAEPL
jgi:ubiquinone/menaquinone biosynthesis C-methylase UbiE